MKIEIGSPDENTVKALGLAEWKLQKPHTNAPVEEWRKYGGIIEISADGYVQIRTMTDNDVLTLSDIIGFAAMRGLVEVADCPNCGEKVITPLTDVSPCPHCGFWTP